MPEARNHAELLALKELADDAFIHWQFAQNAYLNALDSAQNHGFTEED